MTSEHKNYLNLRYSAGLIEELTDFEIEQLYQLTLNEQVRLTEKISRPLRVVISGAGPIGLFYALTLVHYYPTCEVIIFEGRVKKQQNQIIWKTAADGNIRREQVVTLQDDVLKEVPAHIVQALFPDGGERVWLRSRNVAISEVEDRLLELTNQTNQIQILPTNLTKENLQAFVPFDILVGADGSRSFVRENFGFGTVNEHGSDAALGVAVKNSPSFQPQSLNVILTLAQTRYLFNSQGGHSGFINIRLTPEEIAEWNHYPFDQIKRENHPLWETIKEGFRLFNLDESCIGRTNLIPIQLTNAGTFIHSLDGYQNGRGNSSHPFAIGILIGDAALRHHFWPGRGMNTGIKSAIAAARRTYWGFHGETGARKNTPFIRIVDFAKFEGFMHTLRVQELGGRSLAILTETPISNVLNLGHKQYRHWVKHREEFSTKLQQLMETYSSRNGWPHEPVHPDWFLTVIHRLSPLTVNIMNLSGTWPIEEMQTAELTPAELCKCPPH